MGNEIANFTTGRDDVLGEYRAKGRPFRLSTKPYWTTFTVEGRIVAGPTTATSFIVIDKNQNIRAFDYAVGGQRPDGFGGSMLATYMDTNLSKPRQTNSTEDFCIENLRISLRDVRFNFGTAPGAITDPAVLAAFNGQAGFQDIGAVFHAPQKDSPLRLEDSLGRHIRPALSVALLWDGEQVQRIGLASQCPDQQAASLLTAAGLPTESNEFQLPEGAIWRKTGKDSDTELNMQIFTESSRVIVINNATWPGATVPSAPVKVAFDFVIELGGFALKYESKN